MRTFLLSFLLALLVTGVGGGLYVWLSGPGGPPAAPVPGGEKVYTTRLTPIGSFAGEATATRSFDGRELHHGLEAKLPAPPKGKFYEGWLVKDLHSASFFPMGRLVNVNDTYFVEHVVKAEDDNITFGAIIITQETKADGLDAKPELRVLEAKLK